MIYRRWRDVKFVREATNVGSGIFNTLEFFSTPGFSLGHRGQDEYTQCIGRSNDYDTNFSGRSFCVEM